MEKKKDKKTSPLTDLSELLLNGSHEEQKKVFDHVLKKVAEDQEKIMNS